MLVSVSIRLNWTTRASLKKVFIISVMKVCWWYENSQTHIKIMFLGGAGEFPDESIIDSSPSKMQASRVGSLAAMVSSSDELNVTVDDMKDWGPAYQPLANVFAEIAKFKNNSTAKSAAASTTNNRTAPRGTSNRSGGGSASAFQPLSSAAMSSLPSLPKSPVSHDSSYTALLYTPTFTPSMLTTHSPSGGSMLLSGTSTPRPELEPLNRQKQQRVFDTSSCSSGGSDEADCDSHL